VSTVLHVKKNCIPDAEAAPALKYLKESDTLRVYPYDLQAPPGCCATIGHKGLFGKNIVETGFNRGNQLRLNPTSFMRSLQRRRGETAKLYKVGIFGTSGARTKRT